MNFSCCRLLRMLMWLVLVTWSNQLYAQTVRADRFTFNTGLCVLRSGSGSPEGVVTGKICDTYWRTDTGQIYSKTSGTGNTGWTTFGLTGSGTANTLPLWTASTTLGDSFIRQSGNDIITDPSGNDILPATGYDVNIGALTNKYLSLHAAELWVETLVAQNTLATIGGRVLVAPTTLLTSDLSSVAISMNVKHNNLSNGDRIYLEADGAVEFIAVTSNSSGSGPYTYTISRNLDGSGANNWSAGDAILNTGQAGNGFIDLYSVRGVKAGTEIGPTIVGNIRNSSTYNDWSPRWAIGNLNGLYGYSGSTYGSVFGTPSGARVMVDATNGVRLYDGSNNLRISLTTGGSAIFSGDGDDITNIDGGNIQTNTITVGQLLATGFGDNVIKNGTFEGAAGFGSSLAGWAEDFHTGPLAISQSGDGQNGPGTMLLSPGNGNYTSASYLAVPVVVGQTYRVAVKIYADNSTATGFYLRLHESTSTSYVRRVVRSGAVSPDVNQGSMTDVCSNCALSSGWQTFSFVYTVPAGVKWVSLSAIDFTGSAGSGGSTYTDMKLDDVEMQKQIGAGHITANSITANEIDANAITTSELNADSVTSAKIVAGTIVASDIAAGTITADRLNVSSLSAITADLGTVTAGTISGATFEAGGAVTLNSSGIMIEAGSGAGNRVNWDNGSSLASFSGVMYVQGAEVALTTGTAEVRWDGTALSAGTSRTLGNSSSPWGTLFTQNARVTSLGGSGTNRFVCHDNDGDLYSSGTTCDGSSPVPVAALRQENTDLRREINELRIMVQELAATQAAILATERLRLEAHR